MSQNDLASYGFDLDLPTPGMLYDLDPRNQIDSFAAQGPITFGAPVCRGTNPETQVQVVNENADHFVGVALHTHNKEANLYTGIAEYLDTDTVNVLRKGRVWVRVTETVVAGDPAFVDVGDTTLGFCRTSAGNMATGGTFEKGASAGGTAVLDLG